MKIRKLHPRAILPKYTTDGSSAFDVFPVKDMKWKKEEGGYWSVVIETGWAFEIPKEHGMFILSRSGHGFKFTTHLANCVGLLDYDYRGQLLVRLICFENTPPQITRSKAVAQCVVIATPKQKFDVVDELSSTTRGEDGFGSTDMQEVG